MSKTKKIKTAVGVADRTDPYYALGSSRVESDKFWRWGDDNLFPAALALMARRSTTHRRIINDKADYISGKGFTVRRGAAAAAGGLRPVRQRPGREPSPGAGQTGLRQVAVRQRVPRSGHRPRAHLSVALPPGRLALPRGPRLEARPAAPRLGGVQAREARSLPLYPDFEAQEDGTLRSIVHYKDYEPMFEHYGVPPYIAGFSVSAIAWKTDRWNISRLDNSFQLSGVMMLDSSVDNEAEAERIVRLAEQKFAGNPGQVMFVIRDGGEDDNSRFIPIAAQNEGDWQALHEQAVGDIVVAHSWFRTLSGLDYACGIQRRTHSARIRGGAQHGDPRRAGRADGADPRRHRLGAGAGHDVAANRQPPADPLETHLHEGLGGPQGRRTRLRPGG